MKLFLNNKPVKGIIVFSYLTWKYNTEEWERDLVCVRSTDLLARIKKNKGLWKGVTTIRFFINNAYFGYEGYDSKHNLMIALMIPPANLNQFNIFANVNEYYLMTEAEQSRLMKTLDNAEDLK
jgi:hypothetical protein